MALYFNAFLNNAKSLDTLLAGLKIGTAGLHLPKC